MLKRAVFALLLIAAPMQALALSNEELLALVAMPLAVAAVAEVADVPVDELVDVVTLLNQADVPPPQFVEVVRYVPVALVVDDDADDDFVRFVRLQFDEGVRGPALVTVIENRFPEFGLRDIDLTPEPAHVVIVDDDFVPAIVRTRVARVRSHPHGGPPGQLKKDLGLKTGAEVVHGTRKGRDRDDDDRVTVRRDDDRGRGKKRERVDLPPPMTSGGSGRIDKPGKGDDRGRGKARDGGHPGKGHGGGPPGHAKGAGKGKGKD